MGQAGGQYPFISQQGEFRIVWSGLFQHGLLIFIEASCACSHYYSVEEAKMISYLLSLTHFLYPSLTKQFYLYPHHLPGSLPSFTHTALLVKLPPPQAKPLGLSVCLSALNTWQPCA